MASVAQRAGPSTEWRGRYLGLSLDEWASGSLLDEGAAGPVRSLGGGSYTYRHGGAQITRGEGRRDSV